MRVNRPSFNSGINRQDGPSKYSRDQSGLVKPSREAALRPGYSNNGWVMPEYTMNPALQQRPSTIDVSYSNRRTATTVRDVVLGEAAPGDMNDMEHIASVISNRARELGISEQAVVSSGEFDAYGKALPAGVTKFAKQAEAALAKVAKYGPVTNATYYATPDKVGNLGRKVTKTGVVAKTKGHQYYAAPLKAGVPLGQTVAPQVAAAAPSGGLAGFFSDPLGMSAQAATQPGLAAIDKMAGPSQGLGALASSSFDSRYGAPSSAPARAAFDAIAQGRNLAPVQQQNRVASFAPTGTVNDIATPAGGYAVAEDTPHTARALQGTKSYSDPLDAMAAKEWGTQQAATVDLSPPSYDQQMADYQGWQDAKAARMAAKPGTVDTMLAGMDNPAAPALGAPKDVAAAPSQGLGVYTGPTASLSPDMMAPGLMADAALALSPENFNSLQPSLENAPSALAYAPEEQTIDDPMNTFPAAPTPETTFPAAPKPPDEGLTLKDVIGFALNPAGSIIGGLLGGKLGGLGALGGPAGMATAGERYNAGSGLGGINQGMYGPRGATGYSRSNPNTFATSRGPNQGYDLTNQYGARTTYGPSGDIRANAGTNKAWGEVLGGLFGGDSKKSDKDKAGRGKGLGGINGSGYSGNGLY